MPELLIGLAVLVSVLVYTVFIVIDMKEKQAIKNEVIDLLGQQGEVIHNDKQTLFKGKHKTYEVLFYKIGKTHELTVNSPMIWEILTKTNSRLVNQSNFLSSDYEKIIILYPMTSKLRRYINENEMVFVDYRDVFLNMRLVKLSELTRLLSDVEL